MKWIKAEETDGSDIKQDDWKKKYSDILHANPYSFRVLLGSLNPIKGISEKVIDFYNGWEGTFESEEQFKDHINMMVDMAKDLHESAEQMRSQLFGKQ